MTRQQKLLAGVSLILTLVVSTLTVRPDWLMEQLAQANGMGAASQQNCAAPLSLRLKFYDKRPSRETPGPDDLLQPACAVIAAARTGSTGGTSWMDGLRFSLTGELGGVSGQAAHNSGAFTPTFVEVSASAMGAPAGILAFTLSHEIGHGQLRHRERSSATGVVVAIILALLVLTPLAIHLKRQPRGTPTWRFVMWALVFLASLLFAFTIVNPKARNFASTDYELEADKFAIANLERMGYSASEVEFIAACMFAPYLDAPGQSWIDTENPHPSTIERLKQLGLENRIGDLRTPGYCTRNAVIRLAVPAP